MLRQLFSTSLASNAKHAILAAAHGALPSLSQLQSVQNSGWKPWHQRTASPARIQVRSATCPRSLQPIWYVMFTCVVLCSLACCNCQITFKPQQHVHTRSGQCGPRPPDTGCGSPPALFTAMHKLSLLDFRLFDARDVGPRRGTMCAVEAPYSTMLASPALAGSYSAVYLAHVHHTTT